MYLHLKSIAYKKPLVTNKATMSYLKVLAYICAYLTLGNALIYLMVIFRGFDVCYVKYI